ncbi:hypothetical protein B0J11DRAFT_509064 [Dendryphion nanum]|uniref:Uncharacterized protein n=1 Tax=Dendryphion nanum TaxID=256645 RepID=A0A9P9IEM4_9PLEO|nr:hypothetical protein B0J11DRAFT_509064 [Dendryphion nanum]
MDSRPSSTVSGFKTSRGRHCVCNRELLSASGNMYYIHAKGVNIVYSPVSSSFGLSKFADSSPHEPVTIRILADSPRLPTETWRYAKLSPDSKSEVSYISQKLVKDKLKMQIQPLEKETGQWIASENFGRGYVDLQWTLDHSPKQTHGPTRFIVSKAVDPPYDAVLGQSDIEKFPLWR